MKSNTIDKDIITKNNNIGQPVFNNILIVLLEPFCKIVYGRVVFYFMCKFKSLCFKVIHKILDFDLERERKD